MSQLTRLIPSSGPGSGTVTSVSGGNNITITGVPTVNPTVNVSGTTDHSVLLGNATNSINSLVNGITGQVLHAITGANDPVWSAVSLTADVTGVLPIANGGTNASSMVTTDGTVYFDGTRLVTTATGTAGQVLTSGGTGVAPAYATLPVGGIVTINGNSGSVTGTTVTITTGTSNAEGTALFTGSGTTLTQTFTNASKLSIGLGTNALASITTGLQNTALGYHALTGIQSSSDNVAIGYNAMTSLGAASGGNTGVGSSALTSITGSSAYYNTAIGVRALTTLTGTYFNTAVGGESLKSMTTGYFNTAIGASAMRDVPSGINNTVIGAEAMQNAGTGCDNNIIIGADAGINMTGSNRDNNIYIGHAGAAESNTIRIGDGSTQTNCYIGGIDGVNVGSVAKVVTESSNHLGTATITAGTGISVTPGANTITIAATGLMQSLTGDSGGAVFPTAGNTNIVGSGVITVAGNPGTSTLTVTPSGSIASSFITSPVTGTAVPAAGALTFTSGTGISISAAGSAVTIAATGTTTFNYINVNTTPYVVTATDDYLSVDCSGGIITVRLPNAPAIGRSYIIKDRTGSSAANNITVTTVGGAVTIDGAVTVTMNTNFEAISVLFNGSNYEIY